jgi:hypothetical protein
MIWDRVVDIATAFWATLAEMSPFLLLGFAVAGVLHVFIPTSFVRRHLGGGGITSAAKASAFGVPLPLCSCGVIPVGAALRRQGAGKGATTSFLISTPQTGVDSVLVTYALMGIVFAVVRPIAALVSGIVGGVLVTFLADDAPSPVPAETPSDVEQEACCPGDSCDADSEAPGNRVIEALRYGFLTMPADIGRALLVGLVLAALITALVPQGALGDLLGLQASASLWRELGSMALMVLVGVPIYVCATASVPVAAALIISGVSPGAALVFLMTGPATNGATLATIWKVMGRRTAGVYLATVVLSAIGSGLAVNALFRSLPIEPVSHAHQVLPFWVEWSSAAVLLAVLATAIVRSRSKGSLADGAETADPDESPAAGSMDRWTFRVSGMTCSHCVAAVRDALGECSGVRSAEVDLDAGRASVIGRDVDPDAAEKVIRELGYDATFTPPAK